MERNKTKTVKVSLSIPEEVLKLMRKTASEQNKSLSKYIVDIFLKEAKIDITTFTKEDNTISKDFEQRIEKLKYLFHNRNFKNNLEYRKLFEDTMQKHNLTRKELVNLILKK